MAPAPAPIAIVGMSCRLSGDVSTLDDLWTTISCSRDGWGPVPADRFSSDAYYHPNPQKGGCFNQKGGYFMDRDFSRFDAPFFHISEQEAIGMDPQQRQLLECAYEALENAGLPRSRVAGSNMGVFVGGRSSDYRIGTLRDVNQVPMFDATGNHQAVQAGRISYCFDLHGPCLAIDTACSSSLYALHLAVQSIRSGESDSAIVAGCSLHLQPDDTISMSMMGIFNDDGKTFAFDHRAQSGYARGEGVACLILKPLEQALEDRDKIRSVIVGSGTNQDGKTAGIAAPSGEAQERLMHDVYARAQISPNDTGYVEAHGTGTKAGDPIEARAIHRVFGDGRTKQSPLYIGSVKTNFGHLENASGILSVIKATLMLEKGLILPNVNFEKANEAIPLAEWNIKVPVDVRPWPKDKRFVSINNFGFGGSNAHVVLGHGQAVASEPPQKPNRDFPQLLVISANDEGAVKRVTSNVCAHTVKHPEASQKRLLRDMAYTLCERRSHLPWRVAVAASTYTQIAQVLSGSTIAPKRPGSTPRLAFAYTGQGAQWAKMGHQLLQSHPIFADTIKAASDLLGRLGADFLLLEELSKSPEESSLGKACISQPCCTAIQLGLTDLLSSWGVDPAMVVGHSSGEIAAAYAAGALTLEDAMAIAYHRGRLSSQLEPRHSNFRGSMLAVGLGPAEVKRIIKILGLSKITVACENSPSSATVSGDEAGIDALTVELKKQSCFHRKLRVNVAYHSSHMQVIADDYMAAIKDVTPKPLRGDVSFYSALEGCRNDQASLGPTYWVENLTNPVLFSSAMLELCAHSKPDMIVEIGPHSALEGPIRQILKFKDQKIDYQASLVRNKDATLAMLQLAGNLFVNGADIRFDQVNQSDNGAQRPAVLSTMAPYPWSEHKYWSESRTSKQRRKLPFARHDLLGRLEDAYNETKPVWRNTLSSDDVPWLKDHRMQGFATFPIAGYLSMAVEAACQRSKLRGVKASEISGYRLREIQSSRAFMLDDGVRYETVLSLMAYAEGTRAYSNDWDEFTFSSWTSSRGWFEHCRGLVSVRKRGAANSIASLKPHGATCRRKQATDPGSQPVSLERFYAELEANGAGYKSSFRLQPETGLTSHASFAASSIAVPDTAPQMPSSYETPSILSAPFIDFLFQHTFPILGAGHGQMPCLFMPSAIKEIGISAALPNQPGQQIQAVAHGCPDPASRGPVEFWIDGWHSSQADPVITMAGVKMTPVSNQDLGGQSPRSLCFKVKWEPLKAGKAQANGQAVTNGHTHTNGHAKGVMNGSGTNGRHGWGEHGAATVVISDEKESDQLVGALLDLIEARTGSRASVCPLFNVEPSSSSRYICLAEVDAPLIHNMTAHTLARLQTLLLQCGSMLWVTSGAYRCSEPAGTCKNMTQGLLRTIRSETGKAAAMLDLEPGSRLGAFDRAELIAEALDASLASQDGTGGEFEFAEEAGRLVVPRVVGDTDMDTSIFRETQSAAPYFQDFEQAGRRLKVVVGSPGALSSLYWTDQAEFCLNDEEVEIKVAATGINFKDVVISMGKLASSHLGIECSGTVTRTGRNVDSLTVGDRVCAIVRGAYGTHAVCHSTSAAAITADMSFEVAASLPVIYSTAYYAITELARMKSGEKILIHAAAGGVGQAAIQLSQITGAEIYATVGSIDKKQLLIDRYGIPQDRIFYSRNTDFGIAVREATGGKGVDVVLNSLAGDLLRETWDCVAPFGRFIEIGKRDIVANTRLEMARFDNNCTFSSVDLTLVAAKRPQTMSRVLTAVMGLISKRIVHPIGPITTVGISEVESALRTLQSGKTSGKMVVNHLAPNQQVKATHPMTAPYLPSDATYVIIGGTGGIGRCVARRMVLRGARHVVLFSRSGAMTSELRQLAHDCRNDGASIHVRKCDAADSGQVASLVKELQSSLPAIRGVIHAAMVLKDVLFEKMAFGDYQDVVRSKVDSAWNFHDALGESPLDFFVLLSSVAGIIGNRGQAAYAAGNTFLDGFARHRRSQGLAATSLNLAAISDVGYLAQDEARQAEVMKNMSGSSMGEQELLALVEAAIRGQVGRACGEQCITGLDFSNPAALPYYSSDNRFSHLRKAALAKLAQDSDATESVDLPISHRLRVASDAEQAHEIVARGIEEKLGAILMIPAEVMAAQRDTTKIAGFGLDSLAAIELRNWIGTDLQAPLQVLELLMGGLLKDVAATVLKKTNISGVWSEKESK